MEEQVADARRRIRKLVKRVSCKNPGCKGRNSPYALTCGVCGESLAGGIIFSASQSGTAQKKYLEQVTDRISNSHKCYLHDVAQIMEDFARDFDPNINWDKVLDRPEEELRFRRAQAFDEIRQKIKNDPHALYIIACHLTFRWRAYLTR